MNRHGIGCHTAVHCYGCGCNNVSLLTVTEPEKHVIGGDVWFRFKEGYTNAVRKNVRVQDLIWVLPEVTHFVTALDYVFMYRSCDCLHTLNKECIHNYLSSLRLRWRRVFLRKSFHELNVLPRSSRRWTDGAFCACHKLCTMGDHSPHR